MSQILTLLDTTGIQSYIFGSNRLRENIGASALVELATGEWVYELIERQVTQHNLSRQNGKWMLDAERRIERDGLQAEMIYTGGGNSALLFADEKTAHQFAYHYTRRLISDAPGLQVVLFHHLISIDDDPDQSFRQQLPVAQRLLNQKKAMRKRSLPMVGLGVSTDCESTSAPANTFDDFYFSKHVSAGEQRFRPISAELSAKLNRTNQELAKKRLQGLMQMVEEARLDFWYNSESSEPDPESGEGRYVAVVHADGNGMGERFRLVTEDAPSDRVAIESLRKLSQAVNQAGERALADLAALLCHSLTLSQQDHHTQLIAHEIEIELDSETGLGILPFRPLVYGGDDVTFICDGRLGLSLAAAYVQAFCRNAQQMIANQKIAHLPEACQIVHARAGVAVVKLHYPFARAYQLAEDLCKSAKDYINKQQSKGREPFSALDWHFAATGLYGDLETTRQREYHLPQAGNPDKTLHLEMRPICLGEAADEWRTWERFTHTISEFKASKTWKGRKNKVIALREALRQGHEATQRYRERNELPALPLLSGQKPHLQQSGWDGETCGYFDAIEALDFYLPLPDGWMLDGWKTAGEKQVGQNNTTGKEEA